MVPPIFWRKSNIILFHRNGLTCYLFSECYRSANVGNSSEQHETQTLQTNIPKGVTKVYELQTSLHWKLLGNEDFIFAVHAVAAQLGIHKNCLTHRIGNRHGPVTWDKQRNYNGRWFDGRVSEKSRTFWCLYWFLHRDYRRGRSSFSAAWFVIRREVIFAHVSNAHDLATRPPFLIKT